MPPSSQSGSYRTLKRVVDLIGATLGLIFAAPLLVLAALAIRLTSRGPVLFTQERVGLCGRPFRVYKLRTMTGPPSFVIGRETPPDDSRLTPVGQFLRCTGLDEIPQLVNVLRGEMSLVGPRPLLAWEIERCDAREVRRLDVLPGITGLAQINGRNAIPWSDRIAWDLHYVDCVSLRLDLDIIAGTVAVVLRGQDAYAPTHDAPELHSQAEGCSALV